MIYSLKALSGDYFIACWVYIGQGDKKREAALDRFPLKGPQSEVLRTYFFLAGVFFAAAFTTIFSFIAARAAASLATVTRYGEQLT
jgi:hypothetical protein